MALNKNQSLADKIAQMLESETPSPDTAALYAGLEKINHRLDKLEAAISGRPPATAPVVHPSQDKFSVIEAFAEEIVSGLRQEKTCTFEPNGRPCDHCSMCSSRGF